MQWDLNESNCPTFTCIILGKNAFQSNHLVRLCDGFHGAPIGYNNITGEAIFSSTEDALSSDGVGSLTLLHHNDAVLLRKSRGSPFVDLQL